MFLLFVILFIIIVGLYRLINDYINERKNRKRAIEENRDFYIDRYGRTCEVSTGVPFKYIRINSGKKGVYDRAKINARSGKVIRNYSQEERIKMASEAELRRAKAISKGEQFYICEYPYKWGGASSLEKSFIGFRSDELPDAPAMFEDISTGKRYLAGELHTISYSYYKNKPKQIVGGVIGIGLWNVDSRHFEMFYDEEHMTKSGYEECVGRVKNYGDLKERSLDTNNYLCIRWLSSLEHDKFCEGR